MKAKELKKLSKDLQRYYSAYDKEFLLEWEALDSEVTEFHAVQNGDIRVTVKDNEAYKIRLAAKIKESEEDYTLKIEKFDNKIKCMKRKLGEL